MTVVTETLQSAGVRNVMAHRQGGAHVSDDTVQSIDMQLVAVRQGTAFTAEALHDKGRRNETVDFLHAAGETLQLNDQESG